MPTGIMDTISLAASLAFAVPIALFGLNRLGDQPVLGTVFVVIAALVVILQHYLVKPQDILGRFAQRATSRVIDDEESN